MVEPANGSLAFRELERKSAHGQDAGGGFKRYESIGFEPGNRRFVNNFWLLKLGLCRRKIKERVKKTHS
jgi:hypothetical protein